MIICKDKNEYEILKHGVAAKKSIEQRFQAVDDKCGMATNPDVAVAKAECYLQEHNPTAALRITSDVRSRYPFQMGCIVIYLTALVDLEKKSEFATPPYQMINMFGDIIAFYQQSCGFL